MKILSKLIAETSTLIREISDHPDYKALVDKGYCRKFDLLDVQISLIYLSEEVVKDLKQRLVNRGDRP